jgi:dUTP pyrophosphatase
MNLLFKKTELAKQVEVQANVDFTPLRAHQTDAGADLRCCSLEPMYLHPGTITKVLSGVHIWLGSGDTHSGFVVANKGYVGFMVPRSSNPGIILRNTIGTMDYEYQGEIIMNWFNPLDYIVTLQPGERIAQLLVLPIMLPTFELVDDFFISTKRGEKGYGSTGGL